MRLLAFMLWLAAPARLARNRYGHSSAASVSLDACQAALEPLFFQQSFLARIISV